MLFIVDKNTGQLLYTSTIPVTLADNELLLIDAYIAPEVQNPYYNFLTGEFYDKID